MTEDDAKAEAMEILVSKARDLETLRRYAQHRSFIEISHHDIGEISEILRGAANFIKELK